MQQTKEELRVILENLENEGLKNSIIYLETLIKYLEAKNPDGTTLAGTMPHIQYKKHLQNLKDYSPSYSTSNPTQSN